MSMKTFTRSFVCVLLVSLVFLALSSASHAGQDIDRPGVDRPNVDRFVTILHGNAWVRSFTRVKDSKDGDKERLQFGPWKPLHVEDSIPPNSEVRVDKGGSMVLDGGYPSELPPPSMNAEKEKYQIHYNHKLNENSAARFNEEGWAVAHHMPIFQTLRGKITRGAWFVL